MKLRVDIEIQGELLVATAHGTLSFQEGQRALKQVLGQAHEKTDEPGPNRHARRGWSAYHPRKI